MPPSTEPIAIPPEPRSIRAELVRRAAELAGAWGVDPEPARAIFWRLVELSHEEAPAGGAASVAAGGRGGRHG